MTNPNFPVGLGPFTANQAQSTVRAHAKPILNMILEFLLLTATLVCTTGAGTSVAAKKRTQYTTCEKKWICCRRQERPKETYEQLARAFASEFDREEPAKGTLCGILKGADKWLKAEDGPARKRLRPAQQPRVEEALVVWIGQVVANGGNISDDQLVLKAKQLSEWLGLEDGEKQHAFSTGWLKGFKKRFNVRCYKRQGRSRSRHGRC